MANPVTGYQGDELGQSTRSEAPSQTKSRSASVPATKPGTADEPPRVEKVGQEHIGGDASQRMRVRIKYPWQRPPTEQILGALQLLRRNNDVSRRQAFLLLDQGVETLLKTCLTQPASVAHTAMPEKERVRATQGGFSDLLRGVASASGDRVTPEDLDAVWYYHRLRNKLQHEEPGITVAASQAEGFAKLAVRLLKDLLDVDLSQQAAAAQAAKSHSATDPVKSTPGTKQPASEVVPQNDMPHQLRNLEKPIKYEPLQNWLADQPGSGRRLTLRFDQIETLLGVALPRSARQYRPWWANDHHAHVQSHAWMAAGWRVDGVDLDGETVTFVRAPVDGYASFFDDLIERFRLVRPGIIGGAQVTERSYYAFKSGKSGFAFHWAFTSKREFWVELYIDVKDATRNKAIVDELKRERTQIEASIGDTLRWDPLPNRRGARVYVARPGQITDSSEHLEELKLWGIEKMGRFVDAFRPRILQIAEFTG